MRLIPASRPVTIDKVHYGERWFPRLHRHTDGSLLYYIEYGHDRNFTPDFRMRSTDGGRTWEDPTDNTPRVAWQHSFADGELFELDCYGVHDPKTKDTFAYYGAWSRPGVAGAPVRKELVRVHAPSARKTPLPDLARSGYPTFPWWPLWNGLHGTDQLKGHEITIGPYFTPAGVELEGRLLGLGNWPAADESIKGTCVWCFESRDRGKTWEEIGTVGKWDPSMPEGVNESGLQLLRDGRLYTVLRTGGPLVHTWSSDGGRTWAPPQPLRLIDEPDYTPGMTWPITTQLTDGTLVLVYGRPGKNIVFDPSGTGTQWQGRLDLHKWELDTQARNGVPEELRLHGPTHLGVRYWDSGDYLFVVPDGDPAKREMLVGYDVQSYVEHKDAKPYSGVRMLRVRLKD
jgi:hypothetical protein